jgi:CheY-like chemotaxis protein
MEQTMNPMPVLLVEDNPDDEMFVLRAFKENNIPNQVIVARDGQEAIDYLFAPKNELPAFILLDLNLPKISGLEVLKRVRADPRTQLLMVVVLTSSTRVADLKASYSLGSNSYIVKSLDMARFTLEIGQLARYWLEINKSPP